MRQRLLVGVLAASPIGIASDRAGAEGRVDRNVVFGMYSGLALLMDVNREIAKVQAVVVAWFDRHLPARP